MDSKTYIANAIRTESVPAVLNVNEFGLHAMMELAAAVGTVADQFKRRIYYTTPTKDVRIDRDKALAALRTAATMVQYLGAVIEQGGDVDNRIAAEEFAASKPEELPKLSLDNLNVRALHAAIGCFTESAELIESVKAQYEGKPLDLVNFGEEIGDIEWYQAIGFDASGVSEATCREKNIAKLKERYPDKFSGEAAVERNLVAERAILAGDTAHLNASPANATHLESSIAQLRAGDAQPRQLIESV